MSKSFISVIVPIYNTEQYLHRCIDSILSQTYTNFELLLIDDGSSDGSGNICDKYAEKDPRVRVFHKENGGVSSARNLGLDNANGEWVTFVDSDDWIEKEYLKDFIQDCDLCLQGYYNGDNIIRYEEAFVYSSPGAEYLKNKYVSGPYCKLFKGRIIKFNKIKFDEELSYGEDILFLMEYLLYVKSMSVLPYANYHYERQDSSLSLKPKSYNMMYKMYTKHIRLYEELLEEKYQKKYIRKEVLGMFFHFIQRQNQSIKTLRKDKFFDNCYNNHLSRVDKFIFTCFSSLRWYELLLKRF